MNMTSFRRQGEWLVTTVDALNEQGASIDPDRYPPLRAGSHPHIVRQRLLALALFPEKWVNRLFSVGGIQCTDQSILLRAFEPADKQKELSYRLAQLPAAHERCEAPVLYEDDWCVVFDKPSGMPVHPNGPGHRGTLDEAAARYALLRGDPLPMKHIHRLDDDTSGPVLYAKNELAQLRLDESMREKRIDREYEAIVQGQLRNFSGKIDAPIGKDRHHGARRRVSPGGDHAVTHYEVVRQGSGWARLRLRLETGRTHQIRVHMSHIGHPLAGDDLYGGRTEVIRHQALRGARLTFPHPFTGDPVQVDCPEPAWFSSLAAKLAL
ncbi:RluA family pseudouridine synthase [Paenibacillus aurantiacus]|uniref:Pseudouridine synthase n=1 Tax=Paenibacillus aurantiacus TaxID=1936118 RepID=A0ABV5KSP7_9BACL